MLIYLLSAATPSVATENMQFLYDNHGPYLKIYFNENNINNMSSDYELFDRSQNELPNYNRDSLNNFLPNTQTQLPYNSMGQQPVPMKNPSIQSSVIHHLVSSLGPNKTGSYSPFGETIINNNSMPAPVASSYTNAASATTPSNPIRHHPLPTFTDNHADHVITSRSSVESINLSIPSPASSNLNNVSTAANVKKTRIVAEVKPMRMSYSDVLSKTSVNGQEPPGSSVGNSNSASSSPNTTLPVTTKSVKIDKSKFTSGNFDKKMQDTADKENQMKAKKSPINSNAGHNGLSSIDSKKVLTSVGKSDKPTAQGHPGSAKKRTSQGVSKDSSGVGYKAASNLSGSARGIRNKHTSDSDDEEDENSSIIESEDDDDDDDDDIAMEFYNVRKNIYHGDHHNIEKIIPPKGTMSYKKAKNSTIGGASKKVEKIQKRTVKSTSRKRQKHEVLLKLCMAWGEYLLKFIQWLWILILDVGYLSCGIIWDRMSWCYQCAAQAFETVRHELNGSPGKALWLWMKNLWKVFDGKFEKKSRWAFWRWMFKKKQPASEQVKDYYKDGKLPKTAEEAMKSLLNCKGKDAYR